MNRTQIFGAATGVMKVTLRMQMGRRAGAPDRRVRSGNPQDGCIVIRALAVVFLMAFSGGCYAMSGGGQHFRVSNPASAFLACHEVASGLEGRVLELMAYASDDDMPSPAIDRAIRDAAAARVRATEVLIVLVRELQRAGYHLTEVRCP